MHYPKETTNIDSVTIRRIGKEYSRTLPKGEGAIRRECPKPYRRYGKESRRDDVEKDGDRQGQSRECPVSEGNSGSIKKEIRDNELGGGIVLCIRVTKTAKPKADQRNCEASDGIGNLGPWR